MQIHLLSKRAGTISVEQKAPGWTKTFLPSDTLPFVATWENVKLLILEKSTDDFQFYYVNALCGSDDELVTVIPQPFYALFISLENSIGYQAEGMRAANVFHERGFNMLAGNTFSANIHFNKGVTRSLLIILERTKVQSLQRKYPRLEPLLASYPMNGPIRLSRFNQVATPLLMELTERLQDAGSENDTILNTQELIETAISILVKPSLRSQIQLTQAEVNRLYVVKDLLKENLEEHFSIDHMAQHAGLTVSQLRTWFPKVFGITAIQFHHDYKMKQARVLLKAPQRYTLDVIAAKLGFFSASTFTRAFKAHFKMLPSEFVQRCAKFWTTLAAMHIFS